MKHKIKIEYGSTRTVFVLKHFVIKIPTNKEYRLFLHGVLANLQEKRWSGKHSDLAKVIFCDILGLFLIMQKAEILDNSDYTSIWLQCELERKYKDDDLKEFLMSDSKPSNWGYINNHLVKIDYGN